MKSGTAGRDFRESTALTTKTVTNAFFFFEASSCGARESRVETPLAASEPHNDRVLTNSLAWLTFIYLASYLLVGGLGFLVMPELTLRLLLSNGSYGDIMPRLVGTFMVALGGVILQFVWAHDYRYYRYSIVARTFIVVAMTAIYLKARDPLFLVLDTIVLVGLLPSIYVAVVNDRSAVASYPQRPAA